MKLILSAVLMLTLSLPAMSKTLIGKVNIQKVLLTIKEGKKVRNRLEKNFKSRQKELQGEEGKIRKMQEDFKKQSLVMNEKTKLQKEQEIQKRIMQLQQKSLGHNKELQALEDKLKKPILEKLRKIINTVSKSSGVDLTFEVSTTPIVYAKNEKDLTAAVVKAYDTKHPGK